MSLDAVKEKIKNSYLYVVFIKRGFYGNGSALRKSHRPFNGYGCFVFSISIGRVKIYIFIAIINPFSSFITNLF